MIFAVTAASVPSVLTFQSYIFITECAHSSFCHLSTEPVSRLHSVDNRIKECVAVDEIRVGRGNRCTRRKSVPVPLRPQQVPREIT
jgi:hypothetical protein